MKKATAFEISLSVILCKIYVIVKIIIAVDFVCSSSIFTRGIENHRQQITIKLNPSQDLTTPIAMHLSKEMRLCSIA